MKSFPPLYVNSRAKSGRPDSYIFATGNGEPSSPNRPSPQAPRARRHGLGAVRPAGRPARSKRRHRRRTRRSGSQKPHFARDGVAGILGLPQDKVHGVWVPGPGS